MENAVILLAEKRFISPLIFNEKFRNKHTNSTFIGKYDNEKFGTMQILKVSFSRLFLVYEPSGEIAGAYILTQGLCGKFVEI